MRISDWSSDVCSSDLEFLFKKNKVDWLKGYASFEDARTVKVGDKNYTARNIVIATGSSVTPLPGVEIDNAKGVVVDSTGALERSEERRGGKECVSKGRSRWST